MVKEICSWHSIISTLLYIHPFIRERERERERERTEIRYLIVSKRKRIHSSCEDEIEKSIPRDHRSASPGKPRDASR